MKTTEPKIKQLRVTVTAGDIKGATPKLPTCCPIARALIREGAKEVRVYAPWVKANCKHWEHSRRSLAFLWAFDQGKKVKPATFILKPLRP